MLGAALALAACSTSPTLDGDVCDAGVCGLFGCPPECTTICSDTGCKPVAEHQSDRFVGVPVVEDGAFTDLRDAQPPSTDLEICGGDLPSQSVRGSHDAPCHTYSVGATDKAAPDYLGHNNDDEFRHVYYLGGDPACVGTGPPIGSGRDCNAGEGDDGQCAYIAQGYHIYALTGGSCSQHGVPLCSGLFCR